MTDPLNPCPDRQRLRALLMGRLERNESDALFDHLHDCAACERAVDELEAESDPLVRELRDCDVKGALPTADREGHPAETAPPVVYSTSLKEPVMSHHPAKPSRSSSTPVLTGCLLVAGVLLAIGTGLAVLAFVWYSSRIEQLEMAQRRAVVAAEQARAVAEQNREEAMAVGGSDSGMDGMSSMSDATSGGAGMASGMADMGKDEETSAGHGAAAAVDVTALSGRLNSKEKWELDLPEGVKVTRIVLDRDRTQLRISRNQGDLVLWLAAPDGQLVLAHECTKSSPLHWEFRLSTIYRRLRLNLKRAEEVSVVKLIFADDDRYYKEPGSDESE